VPVFGKDHAATINLERDDDSKKVISLQHISSELHFGTIWVMMAIAFGASRMRFAVVNAL
jgi:hypothetical protein